MNAADRGAAKATRNYVDRETAWSDTVRKVQSDAERVSDARRDWVANQTTDQAIEERKQMFAASRRRADRIERLENARATVEVLSIYFRFLLGTALAILALTWIAYQGFHSDMLVGLSIGGGGGLAGGAGVPYIARRARDVRRRQRTKRR